MKARLRTLWEASSPGERAAIATVVVLMGAVAYLLLVQSAGRARERYAASAPALRAQASRLEQQAAEYERLRASPVVTASETDLRTVIQREAEAAGLSGMIGRLDAKEANQVQVVFGEVPFADWLDWVSKLQSQQVRLEACRLEALSTAGLVSVTATFVRTISR
jgi:type II secretory pathway component PulM